MSADEGVGVSSAECLLSRRLRVAETTVEALEAALARKERLLGEAAEREKKLRDALDTAQSEAPGPGPGNAESRVAEIAWRERALSAEAAREVAEHVAQRTGDENTAFRAVLERARDAEADGNASGGMLDAEIRAALAEGALVTTRERADAAEAALMEWQTHARALTARLERAESAMKCSTSAALGDKPDKDNNDVHSVHDARYADVVAELTHRLEETERLCLDLTSRGEEVSTMAVARPVTPPAINPPASPQERRAHADIAVAKLERSQAALRRHERVVNVAPDASGPSSALATALAAARRVSEAADRRAEAGAAALERARQLERITTRRMTLGAVASKDVDVKRAVAKIEGERTPDNSLEFSY